MTADSRKKFKAVAEALQSKVEAGQFALTSCITVMDNIVGPAMRAACQEIQSPRLRWSGNSLTVAVIGKHKNELSFSCDGSVLLVTMTRGGLGDVREFPVETVSEAAVVELISSFFREALDLTP